MFAAHKALPQMGKVLAVSFQNLLHPHAQTGPFCAAQTMTQKDDESLKLKFKLAKVVTLTGACNATQAKVEILYNS